MARPLWSGSISFGLVNIPVRLFSAVQEQRVAFHLLHDHDKVRLRRKMFCPKDGKEVHPEHIVKGFQVGKEQYVVVRQQELESCAPEKIKTIEITDFVPLDDIDPIYFERPYYLVPQAGAAKSYRLLLEAMRRSKQVGVARVVFHDKEHLVALRAIGEALCLETMHFGDEIIPIKTLDISASARVGEKELKAAQQLIESLSSNEFKPQKYHDEYRERLLKLIQSKAEGEEVVFTPPPPEKQRNARASNLMAALEASLAQAKNQTRRRKSA